MKRMLVGVLAAVMVSAVGLFAQAKPEPAKDSKTVFSGCLVRGGQDSFMLINAKEKGQKGKETKNLFLAEENQKVDIAHFERMEVEVTGAITAEGAKTIFTVSKVKRVSDYCG